MTDGPATEKTRVLRERAVTQRRVTYWDSEAYSWGQHAFAVLGTFILGPFAWLVYGCRPEGRERKMWVDVE